MDLKTLHKRVVKLEKLVDQLSKWTHFSPEVGPPEDEILIYSASGGDENADQDADLDDFTFEILPDPGPGVGDEDDHDDPKESNWSDSDSGDDSDYTPHGSSTSKTPTWKKMKMSRKSGGRHFTWSLPTSSSVQRAIAISATTSAGISNQNQNQSQDQVEKPNNSGSGTLSSVILKTEVDFPDEFNENDERDLDFGGLYPDQGDFDDDENGGIQVISSQQGRPMIEKDGYLFQLHKHSKDKRVFRCDHSRQDNGGCPVRLHTNENLENPRLLLFTGEHNHPPNPHAAEVRKVVAVIRQEALNHKSTPAEEIIKKCLEKLPPELKDHLPRRQSLKRTIQNARGEISENKMRRKKYPRFQAPPATPTPASAPVSVSIQTGPGPDTGESSNSNSNSTTTTTTAQNAGGRLAPEPQPTQPRGNPPLAQSIQLLESSKGNPILEKGGYFFQLHKTNVKINKRIWRCGRVGSRADNCFARIHTTYNLENLEELGQIGEHSHPANPMTVELRRVMTAIRHDALTTSLTPKEILANHVPQLPPEAKRMLRKENAIRLIRRLRESLHPGTSTSQDQAQNSQESESSSNSNLHQHHPPEEFNLLQPFPPAHPYPQEPPPSLLLSSLGGHHSHSSGPGWDSTLP